MNKSDESEKNYLMSLSEKLQEFLSLSERFPNDMKFGKECRSILPTIESNRFHPNDQDLGRYVRRLLNEKRNRA